MELDDLKEKWKATNIQSTSDEIRLALENRLHAVKRSGRGIRRVFMIEMIIVSAMYLGIIFMILFMGEKMLSYIYKLCAVTLIGSIPGVVRLYKSQKWINSMDYGNDMRSNMIEFTRYFKKSLDIYKWSTYIVVAILFIMMFTDTEFLALSPGFKITMSVYMVLAALFAGPYIRIIYGRKTAAFEDFLRD